MSCRPLRTVTHQFRSVSMHSLLTCRDTRQRQRNDRPITDHRTRYGKVTSLVEMALDASESEICPVNVQNDGDADCLKDGMDGHQD